MRAAALLIVSVGTLGFVSPLRAEIPWQTSLKAAHEQARQEGKLLLLHFYSDNCVYCDRLEAGVFQSPTVAESIAQHYVPVKVHAGKNPTLASTFRVTRWPTDVIVTPDGAVLSHAVSPQAPTAYGALLTQHSAAAGNAAASLAARPAAATTAPQAQAAPQTPPATELHAMAQHRQTNPYAAPPPAVTAQAQVMAPIAPPAETPTNNRSAGLVDGYALPPDFGGIAARPAGHREPRLDLADPTGTPTITADAPPAQVERSSAEEAANQTALGANTPPGTAAAQPPLAIDGYCPVSVVDGETWVAGDPSLGVIHLGQLYLFADATAMEKFLADPVAYTPVMNGIDVVRFFEERRVVPGSREWAVRDPEFNRVFMFADEASMNHFYNDYQRYTRSAIEVTRQAALEANSVR